MNIKILIPTRADKTVLEPTLNSISKCEAPSVACEIVVIENGGKGVAENVVRKVCSDSLIPIRYYNSPCAGKSAALNGYILKHTNDQTFLIFTDDDVRFNAKWVVKYADAAKQLGDRYFYGSAFHATYEKEPDPKLSPYFFQSNRGLKDGEWKASGRKMFLGFNWAVHAKTLNCINGFDENLGPGSRYGVLGEETVVQEGLMKHGIRPYWVGNNYVWHWVSEEKNSLKWLKERYYHYGFFLGWYGKAGSFLSMLARTILINPVRAEGYALGLRLIRGGLHGRSFAGSSQNRARFSKHTD